VSVFPLAAVSLQTRVFGAALGLALVVLLVELVRRRRLQERYTVAWSLAAATLLSVSLFPQLLELFASLLGVSDTTDAFLALALLCCFGLVLVLTVVVSRLAAETTRLAQELALERAWRRERERTCAGQEASE
jgi:hypothetical protein